MLTKLKLNWADPGRSQQLVISVKTKLLWQACSEFRQMKNKPQFCTTEQYHMEVFGCFEIMAHSRA